MLILNSLFILYNFLNHSDIGVRKRHVTILGWGITCISVCSVHYLVYLGFRLHFLLSVRRGSIFLLALNVPKTNISAFMRLCNVPNCSQILRNLCVLAVGKWLKTKTKQPPNPPPPTPNKHTSPHVFLSCISVFYTGILKSPPLFVLFYCAPQGLVNTVVWSGVVRSCDKFHFL